MNVKLKVLTAGVMFFTGQALVAQEVDPNDKETQIEEVQIVAVAYGTQTKESVTGSVGQIKAAALKDVAAPNVVQGAIGKVAGVQISSSNGLPGSAPIVRFRGIGSINGSSAPLYVVDGVPFNGDIAAINSADIESMSFLKDASAAALYGSRGANGVIIITTKKGRKGKTRYNLDIKAGVASKGISDYNLISSPQEYYEAYHRMLKNSAIASGMSVEEAHAQASSLLVATTDVGLAYNITNVAGDQIIGADGRFNPNASILYQEDWGNKLFREGFFRNVYFSGSGGNDVTSHFFSLGYESNDTYMVNSKFERVTSRLKLDTKLGNRLKFGGNLAYTYMVQNAPDGYAGSTSYSNPFNWTRNIAPIYPVYAYDASGNPVYVNGERAYDDGTGRHNGGIVRPYGSLQNPLATALLDIKKNTTNQIFASAYGTVNILKGLDFTYTLTGEFRNYYQSSLDTALYGDAVGVNGRVGNYNTNRFAVTNQQLLTYERKFGALGLQVLAGHETLNRRHEYLSVDAQNGLLLNSPYINQYAIINEGNGYGVPYSTEGYFGRVNLDFKNRYYINANIRRDGSSRFHKDNRWGTFFGIGGAWVVSKEEFLANSSWLNNLRLKVSYGEQGNDDLNNGEYSYYSSYFATPYTDLYEIKQTFDASVSTVPLNQVFKGNKDLTWEKNRNFNVGFDLELFNNRVSLEAEYFNRKSSDMLFMRPLPLSEGFASQPQNIGDMVNRGVEVNLRYDIVRNDNLSIGIFGNTTYIKNKITSLAEEEIVDGAYLLKVGNSRYTRRYREFAGVNPTNGNALFTVIDATTGERGVTENYSDATLIDTGKSAIPKFYGGFGLDAKFKNFDFGINFAYQFGGWGYDNTWMNTFDGSAGESFHRDYANTWSYDNPTAQLPVVVSEDSPQNYYASTLGMIRSDYVSLQNVTLGYTFNKDILNVAGIDNIRVYATADNVYVWSKRKGYDPRLTLTGVSDSRFSPIRTIAVGFNVSF